jgi:hypothetical protein
MTCVRIPSGVWGGREGGREEGRKGGKGGKGEHALCEDSIVTRTVCRTVVLFFLVALVSDTCITQIDEISNTRDADRRTVVGNQLVDVKHRGERRRSP